MSNNGRPESRRHRRTGLAAALIIIVIVIGALAFILPISRQRAHLKAAANRAEALAGKGDAALAEGRLDDAIFAYMRASRLFPKLPGVQLGLAKALMFDGRGDEAIEAFSAEVERDENSVEGHLLLGFLNLLKAAGTDPLGYYLVDVFPKAMGYPGLSGKVVAFADGDDYPLTEALYHFKFAEELAPHEIRAALGLGVMKALQGDYDEAESRLRDVLERDPENSFAADALVRIPLLATLGRGPGGPGFPSADGWPGDGSGAQEGFLPPMETDWMEVDPGSIPMEGEGGALEPPDVTQEGTAELPQPVQGETDEWVMPEPMIGPDGELILPPDVFKREPKTRPIGPISYLPGEPPKPYVTIANRYKSGQVVLSVGQSAEVPNSRVSVKVLAVEGGNTVVLLEEGEEYTWVRGKVEWVLKPKEMAGDDSTGDENSEEESGDSGE
jgi:tetratricopeptide (TPR) repeat protein